MSQLSFRLATASDHDSILDISQDALGGIDYIVGKLPHLLVDPNYNCFIGETNGQTIAFLAGTVELCGRKLFVKAGRVKEEWRGKGVFGSLLKFIISYMKRKYPAIETLEFGTTDSNQSLWKIYKDIRYTVFMKQAYLRVHLKKPDLQYYAPDVAEWDLERLTHLFRKPKLSSRFFPTRIFIGWEMYLPILSEMRYVRDMNPTILVTVDKTTEPEEVTALSTLSSYLIVTGMLYIIQIHFPQNTLLTISQELAQRLIIGNLSRLTSARDGDFLCICTDLAFAEAVKDAAKSLKLNRTKEEYHNIIVGFNRQI